MSSHPWWFVVLVPPSGLEMRRAREEAKGKACCYFVVIRLQYLFGYKIPVNKKVFLFRN